MIPILILAGHPVETRQIAGLEAGADDVVAKPISFRLLLSRIRALQRRRERYFPPSMT
jgi:DNA-binding response OmpR family regulator